MKTIIGNILDIPRGVIVHQTNCLGVMGGGLAAQIRQRWPLVNKLYEDYCYLGRNERWRLLGTVQFVPASPYVTVANAFGQLATSGPGERATNYMALAECLKTISQVYGHKLLDIYFPYKIGCGLGGGDWDVVLAMLNSYCPTATIVQLPNTPSVELDLWSPYAAVNP